jgi:DNA-binding transcriptional regulator LsrR (DeoR family)
MVILVVDVKRESYMERLPLPAYVQMHGQGKTAEELGVYQSAISKALKKKRNITVWIDEDGKVKAEELRPFPSPDSKRTHET